MNKTQNAMWKITNLFFLFICKAAMQELISKATYFIWKQMGSKIQDFNVFKVLIISAHMFMIFYYTQLKQKILNALTCFV